MLFHLKNYYCVGKGLLCLKENPDEDVVANSTAILVNNLTEAITNDDLVARFQKYGIIKKVNKKNHYAFITYNDR